MIRELLSNTIDINGSWFLTILFFLISLTILFYWNKFGRKTDNRFINFILFITRFFSFVIISIYLLNPVLIQNFIVKNVKPVAVLIDNSGSTSYRISKKDSKNILNSEIECISKFKTKFESNYRDLVFNMYTFNNGINSVSYSNFQRLNSYGATNYENTLNDVFSRDKFSSVIVLTDNCIPKKFSNISDMPLYWAYSVIKDKSDLRIDEFKRKKFFYLGEENKFNVKVSKIGKISNGTLEFYENDKKVFEKNFNFMNHNFLNISVKFKAEKKGENFYRLLVKHEGYESCLKNNERIFYSNVIKSKLSIFFAASPTDLDFKFISKSLNKNKLSHVYFYPYPVKGRKLLLKKHNSFEILDDFPNKEFFEKIDLVILGISEYSLSTKNIKKLELYLNSGSGGFLIFPQTHNLSSKRDYSNFIPFIRPDYVKKNSRVKLSNLGMHHLVMSVSSSTKINELTWSNFPEISGYFKYESLKGGALPLLSAKSSFTSNIASIIYFKSGLSDIIFINAFGFWKWAFSVLAYKENSSEFDRFFNNVISYLGKISEFRNVKLELKNNYLVLDKDYRQNPVSCTLKVLDENLVPVNKVKISASLNKIKDSNELKISDIEFKKIGEGIYSADIIPKKEGRFKIKVKLNIKGEIINKSINFVAVTPLYEYNLKPDKNMIKNSIGENGQMYKLDEFNKIIDSVKSEYTSKHENSKFSLCKYDTLWIILLMLLFIDWSIRKKYGL